MRRRWERAKRTSVHNISESSVLVTRSAHYHHWPADVYSKAGKSEHRLAHDHRWPGYTVILIYHMPLIRVYKGYINPCNTLACRAMRPPMYLFHVKMYHNACNTLLTTMHDTSRPQNDVSRNIPKLYPPRARYITLRVIFCHTLFLSGIMYENDTLPCCK